ncbi:MAG: 4'-phosphopantetheinyl transferase superfamily protein [Lachnospiraceae bacterium]|nr:4'-phosphopantetheinyl transferase superfamily protein [Lachnospiraceae bacterium]
MIYEYAINIANINSIEQIKGLHCSKERITRADRYYKEKDKIRSIISEAIVRYGLTEGIGLNGDSIIINYPKYKKPYIDMKGIYFNISHSGDWIVVAVGDEEIGVDVEKIKETKLPEQLVYFSEEERFFLESLEESNQVNWFYKIWTLKESYIKYTGKGFKCSLNSFSVIEKRKEKFKSIKLDEVHWYALCANTAKNGDIKYVNLEIL